MADPGLVTGLPIGVVQWGAVRFRGPGRPRLAARVGDQVLDLAAVVTGVGEPEPLGVLDAPNLDRLLAAGPAVWRAAGDAVARWLSDGPRDVVGPALHPVTEVEPLLPFTVADYVDFYASEHHATNVGRIFRPDSDPLPRAWKHLPIGYHGRAGTVVVSGTDVRRPSGQRLDGADGEQSVTFGPSTRLDLEAEVGFVVGLGAPFGRVPMATLANHVFGVCLVNDWSARDLQAWETVPLGPFLGKSFATSVSAWVTPLAALDAARVAPPPRDVPLLPYLDDTGLDNTGLDDADQPPWGLDLTLEVRINGRLVSRPPFRSMYWTPAQLLAHLTSNGAPLRTGDLYASGTISGPDEGPGSEQRGCLLELTRGGTEPLDLGDGTTRTWLEDGDEVTITATAPGPDGTVVTLDEVTGRVLPAR